MKLVSAQHPKVCGTGSGQWCCALSLPHWCNSARWRACWRKWRYSIVPATITVNLSGESKAKENIALLSGSFWDNKFTCVCPLLLFVAFWLLFCPPLLSRSLKLERSPAVSRLEAPPRSKCWLVCSGEECLPLTDSKVERPCLSQGGVQMAGEWWPLQRVLAGFCRPSWALVRSRTSRQLMLHWGNQKKLAI